MKKNYIKTLFLFAVLVSSSVIGQNTSNIIINGTAGTGASGTEFATPVKVEQGKDMTVTFTLTHGSNNIERAFMVVKTGEAAGANIGGPYNNIFDAPGETSPYTETDAKYAIPSDAPLGNHTLRFNGKNYIPAGGSGWGTKIDIIIEIVAATLSTEKINSFEFNTYPNPVENNLFINSQEKIQSAEVFNLLGTKVLSLNNVQGSLDVSSLSKSIYILKLTSDKGISTKRFVKK
ncbi:T9SS type A sorting domain-containing protein [Polaribacter sp. Z022]|uniref:T9SS type A sorting domain-containing protein n=1 Tax=Polaribacter sp. Z022 TaxID=2927125 RepID=UPI00202023AA|nr:T9SS type A sorting domain-containing protein [Polaribacter sp. Z022]MCL7752667.1 T9SS type A sorting domain-containing protein [Polaribacter sp. Z022]